MTTGRVRPQVGAPAPAAQDLVLVGEFGRAHGLKGEIRIKSYTADPLAVASYGPVSAASGRSFELKALRPAAGSSPDMLIGQVAGVTSREEAETLTGTGFYVPREKLAAPEEDEFLFADLIGMTVAAADGVPVGTVVQVHNYGSADLLEIKPLSGGASALLPFTKAFVPMVDLPARRLVADLAEDFFTPAKPPLRDQS